MSASYSTNVPKDSFLLPWDEGRAFLSLYELKTSDVLVFCRQVKYSETDFFVHKVVIDIIHSARTFFKNSIEKQTLCQNKSFFELALRIFNKCLDEIEVPFTMKAIPLYARIQLASKKCLYQLHEIMGIDFRSEFLLPPADFTIVKADYQSYQSSQCIARCHDFAFYHFHLEKFFPQIFAKKSKDDHFRLSIESIEQECIRVGKPTAGDLVIYCSNLKGYFQIKHSGIWSKQNRVVSKLGENGVFMHDLNQVTMGYGNFTYFFRKKIKFTATRLFIQDIKSALQSLENFQHSACYSPLTTAGSKAAILSRITLQFSELPNLILSKSLYGLPSMPALKKRLIKSIQLISTDEKSKRQLLNELSITLLEVDRKSPLNFAALT
jgi:hypothetical protein